LAIFYYLHTHCYLAIKLALTYIICRVPSFTSCCQALLFINISDMSRNTRENRLPAWQSKPLVVARNIHSLTKHTGGVIRKVGSIGTNSCAPLQLSAQTGNLVNRSLLHGQLDPLLQPPNSISWNVMEE